MNSGQEKKRIAKFEKSKEILVLFITQKCLHFRFMLFSYTSECDRHPYLWKNGRLARSLLLFQVRIIEKENFDTVTLESEFLTLRLFFFLLLKRNW